MATLGVNWGTGGTSNDGLYRAGASLGESLANAVNGGSPSQLRNQARDAAYIENMRHKNDYLDSETAYKNTQRDGELQVQKGKDEIGNAAAELQIKQLPPLSANATPQEVEARRQLEDNIRHFNHGLGGISKDANDYSQGYGRSSGQHGLQFGPTDGNSQRTFGTLYTGDMPTQNTVMSSNDYAGTNSRIRENLYKPHYEGNSVTTYNPDTGKFETQTPNGVDPLAALADGPYKGEKGPAQNIINNLERKMQHGGQLTNDEILLYKQSYSIVNPTETFEQKMPDGTSSFFPKDNFNVPDGFHRPNQLVATPDRSGAPVPVEIQRQPMSPVFNQSPQQPSFNPAGPQPMVVPPLLDMLNNRQSSPDRQQPTAASPAPVAISPTGEAVQPQAPQFNGRPTADGRGVNYGEQIPVHLTGDERKSFIYATQLMTPEESLSKISSPSQVPGEIDQALAGLNKVDNMTVGQLLARFSTPAGRQFALAAVQFAYPELRIESGAAISAGEIASAFLRFIPRPSDTPQMLHAKKMERLDFIEGNIYGLPADTQQRLQEKARTHNIDFGYLKRNTPDGGQQQPNIQPLEVGGSASYNTSKGTVTIRRKN